ncbi:hypothetical protein L3X38_019860 [Prunus dulcis]|uniref:Uncharacterized protein n=1 Tax=Prunus dulcis TaxID=3755 RepID=A0AAD4WCI5_PRUDU|nr:hypothetical protein L3X38_019860 [Prunus dulcis]
MDFAAEDRLEYCFTVTRLADCSPAGHNIKCQAAIISTTRRQSTKCKVRDCVDRQRQRGHSKTKTPRNLRHPPRVSFPLDLPLSPSSSRPFLSPQPDSHFPFYELKIRSSSLWTRKV